MPISPLGKDTTKVKNQLAESDIRAGRDFNLGDTNNIYYLGGPGTVLLIAIVILTAVVCFLFVTRLDTSKDLEPAKENKSASIVQLGDSTNTDSSYTQPPSQVFSKPGNSGKNDQVKNVRKKASCAFITVNSESKASLNLIKSFSSRLLRGASVCITAQSDNVAYELTADLATNITSLNFGAAVRSVDFSLHFEFTALNANRRSSQVASYFSKTYYLASEDTGLVHRALTDWLDNLQVADDFFSFDT